MEKIWTLDTLPKLKERVAGTRVLLRVDLNVPMRGDKISDITRIERFLPTVRELSHLGCKIILMSHFGRPNGKVIAGMSIKPLLKLLDALRKLSPSYLAGLEWVMIPYKMQL